jgi:anaerobic magnesium-protoporphyrin IX monomethyl ester cyclase
MTNKLYLIAPQKEGLLNGNPISLLYLEEWVRKNSNYLVKIIQDPNQVKEDDAYVGISITTPTYQKGLELARSLKQRSKKIITILGGYHTKGQSKFIIQHPEVDFVLEGEGEKGLVKILEGKTGKIVLGEPMTSEELDSISISDLIISNPDYFQTMRQFGRMNYISTRGCPYSCSFCASSGKMAGKSTKKVADDLSLLVRLGFKEISIQDNYFCYSPQRIQEICKEILQRRLNINWDCQTRVESMQDESLLKLMAQAGCSGAYIGTESFHPEALKRMNKTKNAGVYLRMAKKAVQNMVSAGIKPYLNLQMGLSYENEEIRQTNIRALEKLGKAAKKCNSQIEVYPHLSVVYPGTSDFYSLIQSGVAEDIFESFTAWEEKNGKEIKGLLRENHFIHGAGGIPLGILDFEKLKDRRFEIDNRKLQEVKRFASRLRKIDGVKVYGLS